MVMEILSEVPANIEQVLRFSDGSCLMQYKDGSYAIQGPLVPLPGLFDPPPMGRRVNDAERYYWNEILRSTEELTIDNLREKLYE